MKYFIIISVLIFSCTKSTIQPQSNQVSTNDTTYQIFKGTKYSGASPQFPVGRSYYTLKTWGNEAYFYEGFEFNGNAQYLVKGEKYRVQHFYHSFTPTLQSEYYVEVQDSFIYAKLGKNSFGGKIFVR